MATRQNTNPHDSKKKHKENKINSTKTSKKKVKSKSLANQEQVLNLRSNFETLVKNKEDLEMIIINQESKIKDLKLNEKNLLEELKRQGDIAKEALNKLYYYQQENNNEREKLRKYYEDYYKTKEQEMIQKYEGLMQQSNITMSDYQKKFKDFVVKEQNYQEEIGLLKKASRNIYSPRDRNFQEQLNEMEVKLNQANKNNEQVKFLQNENSNLHVKIGQYEKQLSKKNEIEQSLKDKFSKQIIELQQELKYWKTEMDKVIRQNKVVISKLTPQKLRY
ncbi:unnamed protein product (macronuclear) [Paramecium tetraurelia]|uniref:Growth arrest-specific protein 8 domain-containing protein n=1 Tax=Paramecium tetraurelia TaxID=5888 RepID=A0CJP6_PARTE|nr:uncharacterized protein GSPATT00000725001 [Paramecium tetraurelia]CAK71013.1 unnamed protein product [Paramecium tetraurelia]|eukprot:XP_001438410.1 hypothetical protein (macronuclear) [Paramecium tetraurelia strain d4-2]